MAANEKRAAPEALPLSFDNRVGIAVVSLGRLALEESIPAFAGCKLASALMTGDLAKRKQVAEQYGVPPEALFAYDD